MIFPTLYLYSYHWRSLPKTDNNDITDWDSANGKKTSLNVSSNYALIAEKYNMDITASDTFSKDIELLLAGRTDCVINNTIAFNDFLTQKPDTPIKIAAVQEQADTVLYRFPRETMILWRPSTKQSRNFRQTGHLPNFPTNI